MTFCDNQLKIRDKLMKIYEKMMKVPYFQTFWDLRTEWEVFYYNQKSHKSMAYLAYFIPIPKIHFSEGVTMTPHHGPIPNLKGEIGAKYTTL